jgi:hypothetical protein
MTISKDAERLMLFLFEHHDSTIPQTDWEFITREMGWSEKYYTNVAQEIKDEGYIVGEYAGGNPFFQVSLTSEGRKAVRTNFHQDPPSAVINIHSINGGNNVIAINSVMDEVIQTVEGSTRIPDNAKQELDALLKELHECLKELPADKSDDGEAIADLAKAVVDNVNKEKPNKTKIQISIAGLKQAAQNIGDIFPKVFTTAYAIATVIEKLPHLIP